MEDVLAGEDEVVRRGYEMISHDSYCMYVMIIPK